MNVYTYVCMYVCMYVYVCQCCEYLWVLLNRLDVCVCACLTEYLPDTYKTQLNTSILPTISWVFANRFQTLYARVCMLVFLCSFIWFQFSFFILFFFLFFHFLSVLANRNKFYIFYVSTHLDGIITKGIKSLWF